MKNLGVFTIYLFVGVALITWFGSEIGRRTGAGPLAIAGFALGIILCASAGVAGLAARITDLERQLADARRDREREAALKARFEETP